MIPTQPPTLAEIEDAESFLERIRTRRLELVHQRKELDIERRKLKQEAAIDKWERLVDRFAKKIAKLDEDLVQGGDILQKMRAVVIEYQELDV